MDEFIIHGGKRLKGRVRVSGSKNASLPIMAAALMTDDPLVLRDVPHLSDIANMSRLLTELGCDVEHCDDHSMRIEHNGEDKSLARYDIVRTMRASICVMGPLLAKRGEATVALPGGCAIGDRPIDLHLRGMEALGAEVELESGNITVRAPKLRGARIFLGGPFGSTVLGTANVMSAAALAEGTTTIEQAACEPEVVDLANLLNAMGARIHGAGTPRLTIEGVDSLAGTEHTIMADRMEAGTLMMSAAITNGDVRIDNCPLDAMTAVMTHIGGVGVDVDPIQNGHVDPLRASIIVASDRRLEPITMTTQPHPGFPTDLQAQLMALLTLADGNSIITEKIYPERFLHMAELSRMGAKLYRQGPTVMISGVRQLVGAPVMASDLRASASLVMAGLAAKSTTTINRVYHLDRGYENLEAKLQSLGARIERVKQQ